MRKYLKHIITITLSVGIAWLIILLVGTRLSSKLAGIEENIYLKLYYSVLNMRSERNAHDDIVIFDIKNCKSRIEVATALEKIYECTPKVIALDVFYSDNPDIETIKNDSLVAAIRKIQNKLVCPFVISKDGQSIEKPFFEREQGLDSVIYAAPIDNDVHGKVESSQGTGIGQRYSNISDAPFALAVVRRYCNDSKWGANYAVRVNYVAKYFRTYEDVNDIIIGNFKDKIVLVGDTSDWNDSKVAPFLVDGNKRGVMSGVKNIAYIINTYICNKPAVQEYNKTQQQKYNRISPFANCPLRDLGWFVNVIGCVLFAFAYVILYEYLSSKMLKIKKKIFRDATSALLSPALFLFMELMVVIISMMITRTTNYIPDVLWCMLAITLVNPLYNLIDSINILKFKTKK